MRRSGPDVYPALAGLMLCATLSLSSLGSATLANVLATPVPASELRVDIVGPSLIRANHRAAWDLVIKNFSNTDVVDVPLWLTDVPVDVIIEPEFAVSAPPQSAGEPSWATVPLGFTSPGGRYVPVVIPRIPPGTTVRRIYLTVPLGHAPFVLRAAITPPWADGNVFRGCLTNGGISNPACMGGQLTSINAYLAGSPAIEALSGIGVWAKIAWQCEGAATLPAALVKAKQVLDFMDTAVESLTTPIAACSNVLPPRWNDSLRVTIVASHDPNEKLGESALIAINQPVSYSVRFENAASATAPAQNVVIVDPLDMSKLDLNTVRLGDVRFAGRKLLVPPDATTDYSTSINLSASLRVDVTIMLDPFTGFLSWSFASIDRMTNATPTNPSIGFLQPDSAGSVMFSVVPITTLSVGTHILNAASIKFDNNMAKVTDPPWVYIITDTIPPASHVLPLTTTTLATSIPVSWTADGSWSDLKDYTIFVSEDDAPYREWRTNTSATHDTLSPPGNHIAHTYRFYSVARDRNNNTEPPPAAPDASTLSLLAVADATEPLRFALEGVRPNPARGAMRVWFTLPAREEATLDLLDVAGRRVLRQEVGSLGPGTHGLALDAERPIRPGLYFIRLAQGSRAVNSRVAVIR